MSLSLNQKKRKHIRKNVNLLLNFITMNETVKRYIISSINTFFSGFLPVVIMMMDGAETWTDVAWPAVLLAASFTGVRLVLKALSEKVQAK